MLATTILVDDIPVCVVRPTDRKDLERFIRNGRKFLLADRHDARISYRESDVTEAEKWRRAYTLHKTWSGSDEGFFGVPL